MVRLFDHLVSRAHLRFFKEKNSLITFLFHGLFLDLKEIKAMRVDPQEETTVESFRHFIEYFLSNNYNIISPHDILRGLDEDKKYVLVSFDDGYYNNHRALPLLKEFNVPAVFFISTDNVINNKCYWWDVLYRERSKNGVSKDKIYLETEWLTSNTADEIQQYLIDNFGEKAFVPLGDVDRPFTPSELREFAADNLVILGNHTSKHAILTNYSDDGIRDEIHNCQKSISEITGKAPIIISYPNGNISSRIVRISKELGLKLGLTVIPKKNALPITENNDDHMLIGRFRIHRDSDLEKQYKFLRSDMHLVHAIKKTMGLNN